MKLKRWAEFILMPLIIVAVGAAIAGCSPKTTAGATTQLKYKVQKGTVALTITAVGNVDYADKHELSFDTNGTLSEVDVSAGDSVKKGDVLAKLDSTGYRQNITALQEQMAQKNVALAQVQLQLTQDEQAVVAAQNSVTASQNNLISDQYALNKAQHALEQAQAQAQWTLANDELTVKQDQYYFDTSSRAFASDTLALAKQQLANDQASTQAGIQDAQNAVTAAQNKIAADQANFVSAQNGVTNAQASLEIGQMSLANAQQAVTDAQSNLDQASATSPEITAPIDGLITVVNTTAGQTIFKGQTIVTLVDPNKFEVNVSAGETNISNIKIGGDGIIQIDAMPGAMVPGKISSISPTSTVSSGVVSYAVTVEVVSLQNIAGGGFSGPASSSSGGGPPAGFSPPAGFTPPSGSPPAGFTPPAGMTPPSGTVALPGAGTSASQTVKLRQGMTATVNITYESRNNVLVVPNAAISRSGNIATVKVLLNGVSTSKTIQTGLTNSTMTEVTGGLNEGDEVVYTRTVSSSSSNGGFGGGGFGMPGGGGPPPGGPGGLP